MQNAVLLNGTNLNLNPSNVEKTADKIQFSYEVSVANGQTATIQKLGGYTVSLNHENTQVAAQNVIAEVLKIGYSNLKENQIQAWAKIWEMSDITIDGDVKAQQGIRFNICKSTTRHSFQYFPIESNLFRKRFSIKYWSKRIYWRKIWWLYLLGYRSLLYSFLHGNQRSTSS